MNTNLLTALLFVVVTNWTGHVKDGKELGYVATNAIARVSYDGTTNEYHLKALLSERAVWRKAEPPMNVPWHVTTNFWTNSGRIIYN